MRTRIPQDRRSTLELQLSAAPVGDVLVTVTRDSDGAQVSTGSAQAVAETEGLYRYVVTAADAAQLDLLRAEWAFTLDGEQQVIATEHDVVGGNWTTVAALRRVAGLDDAARYTDPILEAVRGAVEQYLEDAIGVARVRRYARDRQVGNGSPVLALAHFPVQAVRSVRITTPGALEPGALLDAAGLAGVTIGAGGALHRQRGWPDGAQIDVVYEHGSARGVTPDARRVAELLCRRMAIAAFGDQAIDDRARGIATDVGTIDLVIATTNVPTDVPEVNAWIARQSQT